MMRTHGHLPASVYWRRRLVVLGSGVLLLVLLILTGRALVAGKSSPAAAANSHQSSSSSAAPVSHPSTTHAVAPPATTHKSSPALKVTSLAPSSSSSSPPPPKPCTAAQLKLIAVSDRSSYTVGAQPTLMLQVTNTGAAPCVQDLGSQHVELRVYNGESRVWGSNDCSPDSTPMVRTLAVNGPVRVSVVWSGLTSQPRCAGTRQRVGAGTYTLYALLDGRNATAAQFALT